jgi:tRNA(Leu) C34 or U34 (ribose-2'-O)-methylase TrmL
LIRDLYAVPDVADRYSEIIQAVTDLGGYSHLASQAYVKAIAPAAQGMVAVADDPWAFRGREQDPAVGRNRSWDGELGRREGGDDGLGGIGGGQRDWAGDLGQREVGDDGLGGIGAGEQGRAGERGQREVGGIGGGVEDGDGRGDVRRLEACLAGGRPPVLVAVCERIQDPGNAGSVIRAADCAGAGLVVFTSRSVDPSAPKVIRASAGSYFHLPVVVGGSIDKVIGALRAAGLTILAADPAAPVALGRASLAGPVAWVFGNEAEGLSAAALALADVGVRLPVYGRAESLNLAMAATLCLYASAEKVARTPA